MDSQATKFLNGIPVFGLTKTSTIRKGYAPLKKEDTPEGREMRLRLYRQRAELNLSLFDEREVA